MTYQGDAHLADLLKQADATASVEDVYALLQGVVAAPANAGDWARLVVATPSQALRDQLLALKDKVANDSDPGFTDGPAPTERIERLRAHLKTQDLAAFIVPRTDEFQGEYVPARSDRLHWLTGFAGSAGVAVIGVEKAAIFVDGRYTVQVKMQTNGDLLEWRHISREPVTDWIEQTFSEGDRIAYDPWLHTPNALKPYRAAAEKVGATLVPVQPNPIDGIWDTQPARPISLVDAHDLKYAGESAADKRTRLAEDLRAMNAETAVITAPDSIAWLLNIRGTDVPNCPLPLSFALLHQDATVDLFIDARKLAPDLAEHLGNAVAVQTPDAFGGRLESLTGRRVMADPATTASAVFDHLETGKAVVVEGDDPCLLPRACKNDVELDGTRAAHRRDGAAVTKFLAWLAEEGPKGTLTELDVVEKLHGFRMEDPLLRDNSFDTISGAGPHGAIMHYRVTEKTNSPVEVNTLLLVDSGAQYPDGTTDITRTMAIGTPTDEMRERYTLVLKGHIAIATARFPKGMAGFRIDPLARAPLWARGLDFDHGTGHGVGSYLNVHEGPQRISPQGSKVALEPGMILSNEPGYYKEGHYGIRIENLVIVTDLGAGDEPDRTVYGFETITLAPFERALIRTDLLTAAEIAWVNGYHARVCAEIGPLVDEKTRGWLGQATRPL